MIIRKISAVEEVFKKIQSDILNGSLPVGHRFPPQDELARQYRVSRSTIREAMNKLITMGHLESKPGVGTTVINGSPNAFMSAIGQHGFISSDEVQHFMEARLYLEKASIRSVVRRSTDSEIQALKKNLEAQEKSIINLDSELFSELDAKFHRDLVTMSKNPVLMQFMAIIQDALSQFITEVTKLKSAMDNALHYHRRIVEYLEARDLYMSEKVVIDHLKNVARTIESNIGRDVGLRVMFDMESESHSNYLKGLSKKSGS